jgi:CheY-like chemotaxis protein
MAEDRGTELGDLDRQVRDALTHLYDLAHLQTHPLARRLKEQRGGPSATGIALRQELLDAIERFRPPSGSATTSKAYRRYRVLELRYIEGLDPLEIEEQLTISKSEYYREHAEALAGLVSLVRELWEGHAVVPPSQPDASRDRLAEQEIEELRAHLRLAELDASALVAETVSLLRPLAAARGVPLVVESAPGPVTVRAERVVLRQALLVALTQLIERAAPEGVAVRVSAGADAVRVEARGRAAGEPGDAALDLRVAERLVTALGGTLLCRGTPTGELAIELAIAARARPRLLVVDNSADFTALVARYLSGEEWEVVPACDAEEAHGLAQQLQPAMILLDVVMPGRDGWDLLLRLKSDDLTRSIPVVVCSILNEPRLAVSLGADGYLPKPVTRRDLLGMLRDRR